MHNLFVLLARNRRPLFRAELIEYGDELLRDLLWRASFDILALHHINNFAVLKQRHGRRRWLELAQIFSANLLYGVALLSGKRGEQMIGNFAVLQSQADARTRAAGGAAANGVYNDKRCAAFLE